MWATERAEAESQTAHSAAARGATVHHAHLMASDVEATIAFWVECFGGRVVADTALAGVRNVLLEVGGGRLNLYDQPPNHRGVVNHLGVQVDDVEATVSALTEAGWAPRPTKADGALSYAMVQGPDELLIEVFRFDPETTEPHLRDYFDLPPSQPSEPVQLGGPEHLVPGAGDLSPEAKARLARPSPSILELPDRNDFEAVALWRTEINGGWLDGDPRPETLGHHELFVGGVRCLARDTDGARADDRGTVVYLHGGGFCLGSPEVAVPITARIATTSNPTFSARLLSVDYRLAPEHPYPAAVEDVLAVIRAVATERPGAPLVLAGDSAGANLALAAAVHVAQEIALAGLVLLSPHLDLGRRMASDGNLDPRSDVDREVSMWLTDAYRADLEPEDKKVSPLGADMRGLPPLLVQAGTRDNTMSDAIRLARRARSAGVAVTLDLWEGLWHTWHYHRELPEAEAALAEVRRFIERCLEAPTAR